MSKSPKRARRIVEAFVAMLAAGLALAACGGGGNQSEQARITSAIDAYTSAIADRDGATACELLSNAGQRFLSETSLSYHSAGSSAQTCKRAATGAGDVPVGSGTAKDLKHATVANIKVVGNTATALVITARPPIQDPVALVKEGGSWKISRPPGIR